MQAHRRGENDDVSHPFLHPSPLPTIGDSQINFVTLIPVIDAIFIWLKAAYRLCKQNKDADACCSHKKWQLEDAMCLHTYRERGKGC